MKKLAAALLLVPATIIIVGCSRPPEQQFLTQYFRAARIDRRLFDHQHQRRNAHAADLYGADRS